METPLTMMAAATPTRFNDLPREIAFEILCRLPVKPLLQFRCVSKCYDSIITSSDFITKHFKHNQELKSLLSHNNNNNNNDYLLCKARSVPTSHGDQDFISTVVCSISSSDHTLTEVSRMRIPVSNARIVGICKGLFCLVLEKLTMPNPNPNPDGNFTVTRVFEIYLWNPNIRKFKILSSTPDSFETFNCGFGYYPIQNNDFDFKVLRFGLQNQLLPGDDKGLDFQVYTLSTNSWKQLVSFNGSRGPVTWIDQSPCLFVNGALHFIAYSHRHKFILSFDLHDENFREIILPQNYSNGLSFERLAVLKGSLALIAFKILENDFIEVGDVSIENYHIWVMGVYGDVDSWTPYILDLKGVDNFFGCTHSGELVIAKSSSPHDLILFDPKSLDEKSIGIGDLAPQIYTANLMESLVLLNDHN